MTKKYDAEKFAEDIENVLESLKNTLISKNADYGNNVDESIDEWGLSSLAIRLGDKLSRFKNLIKESKTRQVTDEAIEDTLLDLAGYAILGYRKMQEMNHKTDNEIVKTIERISVKAESKGGSPIFTFNS